MEFNFQKNIRHVRELAKRERKWYNGKEEKIKGG